MKFAKPPTIVADKIRINPDNTYSTYEFMCPFCKKLHYHGAADGHRVAHCDNLSSPFIDLGYYIVAAEEVPYDEEEYANTDD